MIPLRLIYWYSVISMLFSGANFTVGMYRISKLESPQIDAVTVLRWVAFLINIGVNITSMWTYRKNHLKLTFWILAAYVLFALPYSHLVLCQFQSCGDNPAAYHEENRKRLGMPKWAYPILLTATAGLGGSLIIWRVIWIMSYVAYNRLFSWIWKTIENHHENIRKSWYLHLVKDLPTLLFIYNEITIFAQTEKHLAGFSESEDVTFTTLSILLICALTLMCLSNGLLYIGLWKERPAFFRYFIISRAFTSWVAVSLFFGTRQSYREISWTLVAATNTTMFIDMMDVLPYFYMVKLLEGWDKEKDNKTAWKLPIVSLKRLKDVQIHLLGSGHSSKVYRGLIALPNSTCFSKSRMLPAAIKHFGMQDPNPVCQELNSLTRICKLKHPHVVGFYGICVTERMSAVFELCENGDLKAFLVGVNREVKTQEYISPTLIQQLGVWSADVAKGMNFLAENDIIHGDLAARNVLLSDNLTAKISDFGLAHKLYGSRVYERLGECTTVPWKWMAPEVLTDFAVQKGSDVWSYGMTLLEIYSLGEDPWQGHQWDSRFGTLLQEGIKPECPTHATQQFYEQCMLTCWELRPALRPSFEELVYQVQLSSITTHGFVQHV